MKLGLIAAVALLVGISVSQVLARPESAKADLSSLTLSTANAVFGQTVTVTAGLTNPGSSSVSLKVNTGTFATASVSSGEVISGVGTGSLFLTLTGTGASNLTATYVCNANTPVSFTIQQFTFTGTQGGPAFLKTSLTCSVNGQPQLSCQQYSYNFSPGNSNTQPCQSTCPAVNASLLGPSMGPCSYPYPAQSAWLNSCPLLYSNPPSNNYFYQNNPPNAFPSYAYPNNSGICSTPVVIQTTSVSPPSQLSISLGKSSQACSTTNVVTVFAKDASGNSVADGATITLSSRLGTISPNQATTSNGTAYAVYTAPAAGGGTEVISATAGGSVKASANVEVSCGGSATGALPALPPPDALAAASGSGSSTSGAALPPTDSGSPVLPPQIFRPPNTGDAGLAGHSSSSSAVSE